MADLVFGSIQRGSIDWASSDYEKTVVLDTPVDRSKSILLFDVTMTNTSRPDALFVKGIVDADGEGLSFYRGGVSEGQNSSITLEWTLIEFDSGVTVRWFTGTGNFGTNISIGATVATDKTWGTLSYHCEGGGSSVDNGETVAFQLIDSGNFQVQCTGISAASWTHWAVQLIEFDGDSGALVQQIVQVLTGGQETSVALGTAIDPDRTSTIGASYGSGTNSAVNGAIYTDWGNDGEDLLIKKSGTGDTMTAIVQVVQWPESVTVVRSEVTTSISADSNIEWPIQDIGDWAEAAILNQGARAEFGWGGTVSGASRSTQYLAAKPGADTSHVNIRRRGGSYGLTSPSCVLQVLAFGEVAEPTPPWPGNLYEGIAAMPEGGWRCPMRVHGSNWAAAVPPAGRVHGEVGPSAILRAWPSMAIDTKRRQTVHFGGGHANYRGNEMMAVDMDTMTWQRICLPSQVMQYLDDLGNPTNYYGSVGGEDDAPASAHTYATNTYLRVADRFYLHGGASYNTGGGFRANNAPSGSSSAGPYIYNLSLRDPDKVGGATGTGIIDTDEGLNAWHNSFPDPGDYEDEDGQRVSHIGLESTIIARVEDGVDVLYLFNGETLWRVALPDPYDLSTATVEKRGYHAARETYQQAALNPNTGLMLAWRRSAGTSLSDGGGCLYAFDINGVANGKTTSYAITPTDPDGVASLGSNLQTYSLVYDEVRDRYIGFNGINLISITHPNVTPNGSNTTEVVTGWQINLIDATFDSDYTPINETSAGVFGKFKYYREYDVFVFVEYNSDFSAGFLWLWKPETDWSPLVPVQIAAEPLIAHGVGQDVGLAVGFVDAAAPLVAHGVGQAALDAAGYGEDATPLVAHGVGQDTGLTIGQVIAAAPLIAHGVGQTAGLIAGDNIPAVIAADPGNAHGVGQPMGLVAGFVDAAAPLIAHGVGQTAGLIAGDSIPAIEAAAPLVGHGVGQDTGLTIGQVIADAPLIAHGVGQEAAFVTGESIPAIEAAAPLTAFGVGRDIGVILGFVSAASPLSAHGLGLDAGEFMGYVLGTIRRPRINNISTVYSIRKDS